jgi:ribosome-binding factor A
MTRPPGKARTQRQLRVGEELRHVLAELIERGDMADPGLRDVPLTVTEVRVSPDLKNATAFVTPLGGGEAEPLLAALARAAPYFQSQIGRKMRIKYIPRLRFELDTSFDQASRIEALLHRPTVARDLGPGGDGEAADETRPKAPAGDE